MKIEFRFSTLLCATSLILQLSACAPGASRTSRPAEVLHFWATWCTVCVPEMPAFDSFAKDALEKGIKVTSIAVDDEESQVKELADKLSLSHPIVVDSDGHYRDRYGIRSLPETIAIDEKGTKLEFYDPFTKEWVPSLRGGKDWGDDEKMKDLLMHLTR